MKRRQSRRNIVKSLIRLQKGAIHGILTSPYIFEISKKISVVKTLSTIVVVCKTRGYQTTDKVLFGMFFKCIQLHVLIY